MTIEFATKVNAYMIATTGGIFGVRDSGLLESAVSQIRQSWYTTVYQRASHLCYSIINNHPFVDGNKRTGIMCMLIYLHHNGLTLPVSNGDIVDLGYSLASGRISCDDLERYLINNCRKR